MAFIAHREAGIGVVNDHFAVVAGNRARNVKAADALDYVAGYTIFNDLSARAIGKPVGRTFNTHWFVHKNFDGSGPLGPWMVPASDIPDPHDIDIKLWVNDSLEQDSNSKYLFFNINEQIEYIAARMTLRPGDVIATGTPSGVATQGDHHQGDAHGPGATKPQRQGAQPGQPERNRAVATRTGGALHQQRQGHHHHPGAGHGADALGLRGLFPHLLRAFGDARYGFG